jgi:hypothetical protein
MKTKRYFTFAVIITVISFEIPAIADLSFYTNRSAWEGAVNGDIVTENFNSVSPDVLKEGINSAGLIDIELTNLVQANEFNSINDGSFFLNIDGTPFFRGACYPPYPGAATIIHLPFSASAFGGDFKSTYSSSGLMFEVNGLPYEFSDWMSSGSETGFLGFVLTDTFSSVTLFTLEDDLYYGESFGLDNVSFAVPEPITLSFLVPGALCLQKRRKV